MHLYKLNHHDMDSFLAYRNVLQIDNKIYHFIFIFVKQILIKPEINMLTKYDRIAHASIYS